MTLSQLVPAGSLLREGIGIAGVRGVPGTAGCLARTLHEKRLVLITTQHVLVDAGGRGGAPVSVIERAANAQVRQPIGTAGWSRRGTVQFDGGAVHVDCGVVELVESLLNTHVIDDAIALPRAGARVTKVGAATGTTEGVITDAAYGAHARIDGREHSAPRQIRVRSMTRDRPFSAPGDSGAILRDETGALVGLLWGATQAGDGIACPIAPVLWVLHARPVRLRADGGSRPPAAPVQ